MIELEEEEKKEKPENTLLTSVKNTGVFTGNLLSDAWKDTKEFKEWYNLPHNIGAIGAKGIESFFTIDTDNPKEVALELIQKVGNPRKGLAGEIISEVPGVKQAINQLDEITQPIRTNIRTALTGNRLQPIYETIGVQPNRGLLQQGVDNRLGQNVFAYDDAGKPLNRRTGSEVLGGQNNEARIWYQKLQQQVDTPARKISKASTHHMNQLMQQAKAIAGHPNGDAILKALRERGIPMGDDITNYTTILDLNPKHLKIARVEEASKLYPNIPRKTLDDAFGAGDFKPPELTIKERSQLQKLKSQTDITSEEFFDSLKRKGQYPTIDLINPDGTKIKWKARTGKEWDNRWKVINKHYGSNIDPKKLYQTKINPELATYAPDHDFLHNEILNKLPSHIRLKELTKSGKWASLPESEAIALLEKVSKDSIRASHKVSKFRYGKISEYYEKFKLSSQLPDKYKNMKWNNLPTDIQQQYFRDNASKLSSYGSRDISNINKIKFKNLTKKEKAFFGIK